MWPFTRKKPGNLYRCIYCICCNIDDDQVQFDLKDASELIVSAASLVDAQVLLAKKIPLSPHVYIHSIKKLNVEI